MRCIVIVCAVLATGVAGFGLSEAQLARQESDASRSEASILDTTGRRIDKWYWLLGILATILGATLTVMGLMMQKMSHTHDFEAAIPYWMHRRWLAGAGVFLLGNLICWLSLGLTNQCLLACINCWNIVVVFVLSPSVFGEIISPQVIASAALLVGGCIWVIVAGPKDYQEQTMESIAEAWQNPRFLCISVTAVVFVVVLVANAVFRYSQDWASISLSSIEYSLISAVFAWYAVLFSKTTSSLLFTSVHAGENQMNSFWYLIFIIGMLLCGACQVHFLNMGLKLGEAFVVLTVYEAMSMTGQVVIGGVFFGEFHDFKSADHAGFLCGFLVVMAGIALVIRCGHTEPAVKHDPFLIGDAEEKCPLSAAMNLAPSYVSSGKVKTSLDILRANQRPSEKPEDKL